MNQLAEALKKAGLITEEQFKKSTAVIQILDRIARQNPIERMFYRLQCENAGINPDNPVEHKKAIEAWVEKQKF